jgi:hypothetical protein
MEMRGRPFQVGNKGGPGRPKRSEEESYLSAITRACPPEKVEAILARQVEKAVGGDYKAAVLVFKVLLGDDPVLTRRLTMELTTELERLRSHANGNGHPAAAGGGAASGGADQPAAGASTSGPESHPGGLRPDAGPLPAGPAPLF